MQRNIDIAEKYLALAQDSDSARATFIENKMRRMKAFYELMDEHNKKFIRAWEDHPANK